MVLPAPLAQTSPVPAKSNLGTVMEFLSKIAAVLVALLLYCVIVILQNPQTAHGTAKPEQRASAIKSDAPMKPGHLRDK
jgi:hypothetical protein